MHYFPVHVDNPEPLDMAFIELVNGQTVGDLLEQLYKTNTNILASDLIIVRMPVSRSIDPSLFEQWLSRPHNPPPRELSFLVDDGEDLQSQFRRVPGRPVHFLFSCDYNHQLSRNLNITARAYPLIPENVFADVRRAEIDYLIEVGKARLPQSAGFLYVAPSKDLVSSFLRIGNIQSSRAAVDALFFWLLPYLKGCDGIVTDTWSIGSTALNTSRRLVTYEGSRRLPVPVEMLTSYFDGTEAQSADAAERIERLIRLARARRKDPTAKQRWKNWLRHSINLNTEAAQGSDNSRPARIVFILSAMNTGSLYQRIRANLEARGTTMDEITFVALFALGGSSPEIPTLRDLSRSSGGGLFAPVETNDGNKAITKIEIDDQTYFPRRNIDVTHEVLIPNAKPFKEFLDRYSDVSLVNVHKDTRDDGSVRHQAIWIDTVALAGHPKFQSRLIERLQALDPIPKVIITPMHAAAKKLAEIAVKVIEQRCSTVRHIAHPNLFLHDNEAPEDAGVRDLINGLSEKDAILLLDDAFITGTRIANYRTGLRKFTFRGRLHYLVAVARPIEIEKWRRRCELLTNRYSASSFVIEGNTCAAIEEFALPDWAEKECPWCAERRLYAKMGQSISPLLRQRYNFLIESLPRGISDELFLVCPNSNPVEITPGSIFAPETASQASVFASVASAIQTLRSPSVASSLKKDALGSQNYPAAAVLDHEHFLHQTYTDSILRASFLRATKYSELNYSNVKSEEEKTGCAIKIINSSEEKTRCLAAEIVLAQKEGKFPLLKFSDVASSLVQLGLTDMFLI